MQGTMMFTVYDNTIADQLLILMKISSPAQLNLIRKIDQIDLDVKFTEIYT